VTVFTIQLLEDLLDLLLALVTMYEYLEHSGLQKQTAKKRERKKKKKPKLRWYSWRKLACKFCTVSVHSHTV
jgi:hypothetical protein